jgi:hypothetical protein
MPEINRGEERTRTVGIALLIVGFVLQIAATPI